MRVVNIGTGVQVSINQLHAALAAAMDGQIEFQLGPARPSDVRFSALDPRLANEVLGWEPAVELAEGLDRTLSSGVAPSAHLRSHDGHLLP